LEFVKHCRSLDISLNDTKRLLELKNKPEESCSSVNALIDQQLALVNKRMKELKELKAELQQMASACSSNNTIEACGIIKSLDS
jgi:DNA-binding transcriptional MerR regulator